MPDFTHKTVEETPYLYVERSCSMAPQDISSAMGNAFETVSTFMRNQGIAPAGPSLSVYYTNDPATMTFRAGFVVSTDDLRRAADPVRADVTPAGRVLQFTHVGPYATLRDDYAAMMTFVEQKGLQIGVPSWEIYLNDAAQVPESELLTDINVALAA